MVKVKTGFKNLNVLSQLERTRSIVSSMTGNGHFPSPNPSLATVSAALTKLDLAYQKSRNRDKVKMELMRLRRKEMLDLIVQLSSYVQNASGGDEEIILSSGFDVAKRATPMIPVARVMNVRAKRGSTEGAVKVNWKPVKGAKVYIVRALADGDADDKLEIKAVPSAARCEITGLTPGIRYRILVAAVGGNIIGEWSNPAFKIAE